MTDSRSPSLDSRALVYLRMGRLAEAIADYDAAIAARPRYASALYGRGIARLQRGDAEGAVADMEAAIRIDPAIEQAFVRYCVTEG